MSWSSYGPDAAVNRCGDRLDFEGYGSGFEGVRINFGSKWRCCRVEEEGGPVDARRDLFEQLQPIASHRRLKIDETGNVAARRGRLATKPLLRLGRNDDSGRGQHGKAEQAASGQVTPPITPRC